LKGKRLKPVKVFLRSGELDRAGLVPRDQPLWADAGPGSLARSALCTSLVNKSTSVWPFGRKITGFGWALNQVSASQGPSLLITIPNARLRTAVQGIVLD
jgi:hypothetical protein